MNFIVLRQSPDWLNFDFEETRPFLKRFGFPETLVIDFARQWDNLFGVGYREFRHAMKEITLSSAADCADSVLVTSIDERDVADDDLIYFTDDDDWVAPHLFAALRSHDVEDGFVWGSTRVGTASPEIEKRAFTDRIYTNNYAVTGRLLRKLGVPAVYQHGHAEIAYGNGLYRPAMVERYLSCTNKHPCSTLTLLYHPSTDLRADTTTFRQRLSAPLDAEIAWIAPYLDRLKSTLDATLQPRCAPPFRNAFVSALRNFGRHLTLRRR